MAHVEKLKQTTPAPKDPVARVSAPLKSGATVVVASKLPFDLVIRICDFTTKLEPVVGGGSREVRVAVPRAESVTIRGNAVPVGVAPTVQMEGGYALTQGVPAAFFAEWLEQNKNTDLVKNKVIFAHGKMTNAVAEAKEHAELKTGLERLDPDKPAPKVTHAQA